MRYLKKIIIGIFLLEFFNFIVGLSYLGSSVILPYKQFNAPQFYYDQDSLYGITKQKNSTHLMGHPWGGVLYKTNSLGFRDNEFTENGILVTGNSFIEGFGVNVENRFSEILEKTTTLSFNNTGTSGVWTPIQSVILFKHLLKTQKKHFKKNIIFLTPGELINIDKRNPKNDSFRNYPYRKGDSIAFHIAKNGSSFKSSISLKNKIKRFSKNLLISKIYTTFKYYGVSKVEKKYINFEKEKLDWFLSQVENQLSGKKIDIVILNNLGRTSIKLIDNYKFKSKNVNIHIIEFPDNVENYFVSNGHLNEKGNKQLAKLLEPLLLVN